MSRFCIVILFALLTVAWALPASADARSIRYCHLFSEGAVGHATGYRGVRVSGKVMPAPTVTGAKGKIALCDYASGRDSLAQWSVITVLSTRAAAKEYAGYIKGRRTDGSPRPKSVNGPWTSAYIVGQREFFALRGHRIFHLQFWVPTTAARAIGLAKTAMSKL